MKALLGMQLKSLKIFCDVVRLGSFSKAAEANGVSQSNVSQLVHQLEDRLGVRLVDTSKRPFVVTPEGRRYHEGCRDVVRRYEELERQVLSLHRGAGARLTVAAIYSVGLVEMHEIVGRFRREHPEVDLRIDYMHPDRVEQAVREGESDLGIVSYAGEVKSLVVTPWREERFAVAAAPGNPFAGLTSLSADRLQGASFVMPQEGLRVRQEIDRWLVAHRVSVRVALEFDNLESVKRAIEVDEGVGLLPAPTFAAEAASGALRRIELEEGATLTRPLGVLSRMGAPLSGEARDFIDLLRAHDTPAGEPAATASA